MIGFPDPLVANSALTEGSYEWCNLEPLKVEKSLQPTGKEARQACVRVLQRRLPVLKQAPNDGNRAHEELIHWDGQIPLTQVASLL